MTERTAFQGRKLTIGTSTKKLFQVDYCLRTKETSEIRGLKTVTVNVLTRDDALSAAVQAVEDALKGAPPFTQCHIVNVILIAEGVA